MPRTRDRLVGGWLVTSIGRELVDGYDEEGRLIGPKTRAAVHRDGTWHRCVHCVIVYSEGPARRVILQRRARAAVDYSGLVDVTVAGHLVAGESSTDAATREIREELGIDLPVSSLVTFPLADALDLWSGNRPLVIATEYEEGRVHVHPVALTDFVNEVPDYWPWLASVLISMDRPA